MNTRYFNRDLEKIPAPVLNFTTFPDDLRQIFASGSVFTSNWQTNNCNPNTMSIVDVNPGTDTIPATLNANTIYRLKKGEYITSRIIKPSQCSGIISLGKSNLYSSVTLTSICAGPGEIISFCSTNNAVISGITLDGEKDGNGGTHTKIGDGIYTLTSNNNLIMHFSANNFGWDGIRLRSVSNYNTLYNIKVGNNGKGIYSEGNNNKFEKIIAYNSNGGYGNGIESLGINNSFKDIIGYNNRAGTLYLGNNAYANNIFSFSDSSGYGSIYNFGSNNVSFSNVLVFNATSGLQLSSGNNVLANNIFGFNNQYSLGIQHGSGAIISKAILINSINSGISIGSSIGSKYYSDIKLFGNLYNLSGGSSFSSGTDGLNSSLNLPNGTLDTTGSFDQTWAVIPNVAGWDWQAKGQQTGLAFDENVTFTFGANIPNQTRPIKRNSATSQFEYYGVDGVDYDSTKKIGQW